MSDARHVIVTGAAGGIGTQLVQDLTDAGYAITGFDVDGDALGPFRTRFPSAGSAIVDLTDSRAVDVAVRRAVTERGRPHGLVNIAGDNRMKPLEETSDEDWRYLIDANLTSTFFMCRAVAPHMKGGGRIINTASIFGMRGADRDAAYSAAKAGVIGLTRALATELAKDSITVNALSPVVVLTERVRRMAPEHLQSQLDRIPLGRFSEASDVTRTMRFLLSDDGAFYTGQTFSPNGGDLMP